MTDQPSSDPEYELAQALCSRIRRLLEDEKSRIIAEIDNYPQPIAGCDAHFSHLLDQRTGIHEEQRRLQEDAKLYRSAERLDEFVRSSRFIDET